MINVTKTFLPPLQEYVAYLEKIWESSWITNAGPLVQELEAKLKEYLGVKHLFFVNNGTIAIQIAIKALELKGEIITTPFSYVATTSSIVWEGCTPVFADIDPETLCLDPHAVESLISPETTALMPVHVYGNPCDVDELKAVADRHGLKIIYDAAHAFGVEYPLGTSVLTHGDISTLSFHATKLFHTCEGGAIVTENDELAHRISYLRNFGHNGPEAFWGLGVNGKCSEVHAAMGLCVLPKVDELIERRRALTDLYDLLLRDCAAVRRPRLADRMRYNYAYYPLVLASEEDLLLVRDELKVRDVLPRRYFYPSLSTLSYVPPSDVPIAEDISKRALCLPLFPDLDPAIVRDICATIVSTLDQRMAYAGNM